MGGEEPAWDTDSEKSVEESSFDDESRGDRSSDEGEENDDDEDYSEEEEDVDGDSMASEDIGSGSEGDGSSHSGSGDSDSDSEDSDSEDEDPFQDEERGMGKSMSSGSLMNEPSEDQPKWTRAVPKCIVAMGIWVAATFCCCLILIPLLIIIIPLALFFGAAKDAVDTIAVNPGPAISTASSSATSVAIEAATIAPTLDPVGVITTLSPTPIIPGETPDETPPLQPTSVIKETTMGASAGTTIYRTGDKAETPIGGDDETMLIQTGPPGDPELPTAFALVQFDGIVNIDSDSMSVDAYLASIENLVVNMCFTVAENENQDDVSFSTCIIKQEDDDQNIEELSGATAEDYKIPDACAGEVVDFIVKPTVDDDGDEKTAGTKSEVCANVASLVLPGFTDEEPTVTEDLVRGLRGRTTKTIGTTGRRQRSLQTVPDATVPPVDPELSEEAPMDPELPEGDKISYLFIIETIQESDTPGVEFFSKASDEGRPSLSIRGENTCRTIVDIACSLAQFSTLCSLVKEYKLEDFLATPTPYAFKTLFAPTDKAFENLDVEFRTTLTSDPEAIINVLKYHVAPGNFSYEDLECGTPIPMATDGGDSTTTVCGNDGLFYQIGSGVSPGVPTLPTITKEGISTCYGTIHTIDEVMIPSNTDGNATCISDELRDVAQVICDSPDHAMLCDLVREVGMDNVFSGGLFTVFAPSNEAFESYGFMNQTDDGFSTEILLQHVVSGSATYSKDIVCDMVVDMANGESNTIACGEDGSFTITGPGNAENGTAPLITGPDIGACNGVIHSINRLIFPSSEDPDSPDEKEGGSKDIEEPAFEPCYICGPGFSVTNMETMLEMQEGLEYTDSTCKAAEDLCLSGACSPQICLEHSENGSTEPCGCEKTVTLIDLLSEKPEKYSLLLDFLELAKVSESLRTGNGMTLFAPTNTAFDLFRAESPTLVENLQTEKWSAHRENLAQYHVLSEVVASSDVTDGLTVTTLSGEDLSFIVDEDTISINSESTKVINNESIASNGVAHRIDQVLLAPWVGLSIAEAASSAPDLQALMTLPVTSFLEDVSGDGPYTVFAPSSDAISKLVEAVDVSTIDVKSILSYHVVQGMYPASAIVDGLPLSTLLGEDIICNVVGSTKKVNGERIISTDILANNGIIHVIDGVLSPAGGDTSGGEVPGGDISGAQTQSCSICSGVRETFTLTNPEALLELPESLRLPGSLETTTTCETLEGRCQDGLCTEEICTFYADDGAKDTCGCE